MTEWERDIGLCLLKELEQRELISQELWAGACRVWQGLGPEDPKDTGSGQQP